MGAGSRRERDAGTPAGRRARPAVEPFEPRLLLNAGRHPRPDPLAAVATISAAEVAQLLSRAAAATPSDDAIIAITDRGGRVLGVRLEEGVAPEITADPDKLVFAVDGAVAKARTGAFFGNHGTPLTSRTIQFISQSTITQREIESYPFIPDPDSTERGPGFVAPIGIRSHFPPNVRFTPQVDLFLIEHTNRDSLIHPGADGIKGTGDEVILTNRFNADPDFIPKSIYNPADPAQPDLRLRAPESYGLVSGLRPDAQSRGVATIPGGIPIFKNKVVVGGIGVFFPGTTGFATAENSALNTALFDPTEPDRSVEAEFIAFAALGGSRGAATIVGRPTTIGALGGVPPVPGTDIPFGRIDLVGITLDVIGPHGNQGPINLFKAARRFDPGAGDPDSGVNLPVVADPADRNATNTLDGLPVPDGWLVEPHDGVGLTREDVIAMVQAGIARAQETRSAIRLPINRSARMIFAVTDLTGELLGLFRMPDATVFSLDVAVAKARNVAYYADPAQLNPADRIGPSVPVGTAITSRTIRYVTLPRFPEGIDGYPPGPYSILTDGGANPATGATIGAPLPASAFTSVQGRDAFFPGTNFRAPTVPANQNGIVFFPGSAPLYKDVDGDGVRELVGGLGVSGDGVDQDDVVTYTASANYRPPDTVPRADEVFLRNVRLPYQKFNRQPRV